MSNWKKWMPNNLADKWKPFLDYYKCHPKFRPQLASKMERIYSDFADIADIVPLDCKKLSEKIKRLVESYDRRENTVSQL